MAIVNYEIRDSIKIIGEFAESDHGAIFEYKANDNYGMNGFASDYPFEIFMSDGSTRFAKILKTVAYIVIDEDEKGNPVAEKWNIKRHIKS